MIKPLQTVIFLSFPLYALGWNVTTEPTNKSVVIEEYTGIHCPNCPDGHKRATLLHHAHPEDLFIVSVHAGPFAEPSRTEPDYITECGTEIHDYFGVNSYPCATVNRRDVGQGLIQGRGEWGSSGRVIAGEESPVNLWSECLYDKEANTLTVNVEGYFTGKMESPALTVAILQDNILGPQSGGLLGVEYPHRHVLRVMLNENSFGDRIEYAGEGTYFKRVFSYSLPQDIKGIPLIISDLQILSFVTEGKGEIVKAVETFPDLSPEETGRNVFVQSEPLIPIGKNYGLGYIELFLDNYSYTNLTEAEFEIKLNNTPHLMKWEGTIPAHSGQLINVELPTGWEEILDKDDNTLSVKMITANGTEPELEVLPIKYSFSNVSAFPTDLTLKITTDIESADNTFRIIDMKGETVAVFGPYPDGENALYEESVNLEPGRIYGFEVTDSWGNGIYHPRGYVKFYGPDGKICGQLMEISDYGTRIFFRTSTDSGIEYIENEKPVSQEYFDLSGIRKEKGKGLSIEVKVFPDGTKVSQRRMN